MSSDRQPLQNIAWLVSERVGRAAITATVLGVVARYLEPAGFGRLNFAVTIVAIGSTLASLGLEGVVVTELIRQPARTGAVLGTAAWLRLITGIMTAGLLTATFWLVPRLRPDALLVSIVALGLVIQPVEVVDLWFQRHLDSRRTVVARTVGIFAGATLKLWLVSTNAALPAFAWAQLADVGFIALSLGWAGWRSPHHSGPWIWDKEVARLLWQRGAPLAISGVFVTFALRLDQLLVRTWLGDAQTGIYFAASRLTDLALFAGSAMALSLFPLLAASQTRSPEEYQARLQTTFDALSALGWLVALGFTFAGPSVILLLYGPAYAGAARILTLQGWGCLFALSATVRWNFIILSAPTLLNLAAALLHIVTLLPLAAWLVPSWGMAGAAGAWLVAAGVSGVLTSFLFPPLRPCATAQLRGLFIPFTPGRWRDLFRQFQA